MFKKKTIDSFFKRKERIDDETNSSSPILNPVSNVENVVEQPIMKLTE